MYKSYKYLVALFLIFLMITPSGVIFAAEKQEKTITFSGGESSSIYTDRIAYYAFKELGYNFSVLIQDITAALLSANSAYTDGVISAADGNEKTYTNLVKVNVPISKLNYITFTREDNASSFNNWNDFSGKTVGMMTVGTHTEKSLPKDINRKRYQGINDVYAALLSGEIEVAMILKPNETKFSSPEGIRQNGIFDSIPTFMFVNKSNQYLVPELENMLRKMNTEGVTQKILNNELNHNDSKKKIVLSISSYSSDVLWERQMQDAFRVQYREGIPMEVHNYSINALKLHNDVYYRKSLSNIIRRDFVNKVPSAVIVSDDEAFEFVKENYYSTFVGAPVIFCAINDFTPERIKGFEDIFTGVVEETATTETVDQMLKMYPNTNKIFVVNDDTVSGEQWKKDMDKQLEKYKDRLEVEHNENLPFNDLVTKISTLETGTLVLFGFYLVDGEGKYQTLTESQKAFYDYSKVPMFGLYFPMYGQGQLGGKYSVADVQASHVRGMLKKILIGVNVADIPIMTDTNVEYPWYFDYTAMKKFGIKKDQLPEGAIITNEPPTFYQTNKEGLLYATFVLVFVIMAFLFIFARVQRKKNEILMNTQKSLHTAEELLERDLIIKEIKSRLEKSIGSAPIGYAVTIDSILLEANNYMNEMFDLKLNESVRGAHLDPLESDGIQEEIAEEKIIRERTCYLNTLSGEAQRFQLNINYVEYNNKTAAITWLVSVEEVEAQKDALRLAEMGLQKIVDTLPIPMLIVDKATHEILYANHASSYLFKSSEAETEGTRKLTRFVELYNQSKEMSDSQVDFEILHTSQEEVDLLVSASEIVYRNEDSIIFICQNISAQKKQAEHLLKAADKEREANQMKSVFLANMSHEIRTPMNAIIGFSQILISDKALGSKQKEFVYSINKSGEHLLTLINDVLEMSKIEAGSVTYNPSTIDSYTMITEIKNMFLLRANAKGISFIVEYDDLQRYIYSDESKLRQIIINLLSNAVKFTSSGGISWITRYEQELLTIEITDTGTGISEDELELIFEPFKQSESGKKNGGTGLGLSISRKLARFIGGDITAQSEYGVGTTFRVVLPVQISDAYSITEIEIVQNVISIQDGKCPKILIVDDKEENLQVLRELLQPVGFIVIEAENGKEAVDFFEHETFDLILMDMRMPIMDGYEASTKMRKAEKIPYTPIIALTASAFEEDKVRIYSVGIDDYIRKPFQRKTLFNAIKKHLDIEYIYEDDEIEDVVVKDTDMSFDAVPKELVEILTETVETADFNEALEVLEQMREFLAVGEYNLIKSLIDSFQYEKISEILGRTSLGDS